MNLIGYYKIQFALKQHHGWSIGELENLIPWERDIYLTLLEQHLKEQEERLKQKNGNK